MPSPRFSPNKKRGDALDRFVNRDKPLAVAINAILGIDKDRASQILSFHGVGGQGKSMLCRKIEQVVKSDPSLSDIRCGSVNLAEHLEREPIFLLVWLRNALVKTGKIRMRAFDFAFDVYRSEARQGTPLPEIEAHWTEWSDDIMEGAGASTAETVAEYAKDLASIAVESTPFVGPLLKHLGKRALKKGWQHLVRFENECLAHLYDNGQLVEKIEFEKRLVHIFAKSLERWRSNHPAQRFLCLIDEYERVLDHGGASSQHAENPFDTMMRDIVASCAGTMFMVFSREPLAWDKAWPSEWGDALRGLQYPLQGLAQGDAEKLVASYNIEGPEIRAAIVNAAMVEEQDGRHAYPVLLELGIELYESLKSTGARIGAGDFVLQASAFSVKRAILMARLLRSYKRPDLEWTLKHLAVARRFDRPLFEHVVEQCGTKMPHGDWAVLTRSSLVNRFREGPWYAFHGVIRDSLESLLNEGELRRTREVLRDYYERRIHRLDHPAGLTWNDKLAIAADAIEAFHHRRQLDGTDALWWWNGTGGIFHGAGLGRTVEPIDRDCIALAEAIKGAESDWAASRMSWLATNFDHQGRHGEAEPLHRRNLAIYEKISGSDSSETAGSLSQLASNLDSQGRHGEAEPLHRRALTIRENVFGHEHRDTAASLSKLASNLDHLGRHPEAESLHRRDLAISKKVVGPEHTETGTSFSNLANNLDNQGRHREAAPLHRSALAIFEKTHGLEHPYTATGLSNLAANLDLQGRQDEAESRHRGALAIYEKVLGLEHPFTATSLCKLASNLDLQGRHPEAEPLHRQAEEGIFIALGPGHPRLARTMAQRARNLSGLGKADEACVLARQAEAILRDRALQSHRWWIDLQKFLKQCPPPSV